MSITKEDILEAVANMSVMDVVALVEAMEEKFGVHCFNKCNNIHY